MEFTISIIIPVYNAEPYLPRLFRSLQEQTLGFEKLQILFSDDHSSDGSTALISEWAAKYSNVILLHVPGEGPSGGAAVPRNLALPHIAAPYLMFLDNDDYYEPDACEALLTAMQTTGADFVSGYFHEVSVDEVPLQEKHIWCGQLTHSRFFHLPEELLAAQEINGTFWCKLYRTELVQENKIDFPTDTQAEDTVFFVRYLLACKSLYYIDKLIYNFRVRDASVSHTMSAKYLHGRKICYDYLFDLYKAYPDCLRFVMNGAAAHFLEYICNDGDFTSAERLALMPDWQRVAAYTVSQPEIMPPEPPQKRMVTLVAQGKYESAFEVGLLVRPYREAIMTRDKHFLDSEKIWSSTVEAAHAETAAVRAELAAVRASRSYQLAHGLARLLHPGK